MFTRSGWSPHVTVSRTLRRGTVVPTVLKDEPAPLSRHCGLLCSPRSPVLAVEPVLRASPADRAAPTTDLPTCPPCSHSGSAGFYTISVTQFHLPACPNPSHFHHPPTQALALTWPSEAPSSCTPVFSPHGSLTGPTRPPTVDRLPHLS